MTGEEALTSIIGYSMTHNNILTPAINILNKEHWALDIIKYRQIDVKDIIETTDDYDLYVAYCEGKGYAKEYICDKEEFELLREVLCNG